jgi:single-strand DNA-binding protein
MHNFSSTVLVGHLGKNPEVKSTPTGKFVCEFSMATSRGEGEKKFTSWHNVQCWGTMAQAVGNLRKGDAVIVVGEMQTRSWENKSGQKQYKTFLAASTVAQCLGYGDGQPKSSGGSQAGGSFAHAPETNFDDFSGPDGIPF